jgi:O-methyltransferase
VNKKLFLFDTFQGSPKSSVLDEIKGKDHYSDTSVDGVRSFLSDFKVPQILVPGFLPHSLENYINNTFCFLHLHLNLYKSTLTTLDKIFERIVPGGLILFEDYGIRNCSGVRYAVTEFMRNKVEKPIVLPTGQAKKGRR